MMLQFTQAGSAWACEFEVTDKINLHIENAEGILLYQRTAAGKFALIKDAPTSTGPVFDYDLEGLVYPKHIRVICSSLPTYAEVVSDGEITEIKSQTKEVEITANGTTQVAPDAGFSYLTGVSIKTNVPQSGGSGGETEYFRIDWDRLKSEFGYLPVKDYENIGAFLAKQSSILTFVTSAHFGVSTMMGMSQITPVAALLVAVFQAPGYVDLSDIKKVAFTTFKGYDANVGSFVEMTPDYLLSGKYRDCFISITEEEFYNLEGGGITDKFVSIRELYQTNLMDNMDTSGTITLTEGVSKVTAISVEVPADWSSLVDTLFSLGANGANQDNPKLYTITVTPSNESCMIGTTGSQMDLIKNGEIVQSTLDEVNSELSSGEYYYLGGYQNLSEDKLDTLDKFIKVKTV